MNTFNHTIDGVIVATYKQPTLRKTRTIKQTRKALLQAKKIKDLS